MIDTHTPLVLESSKWIQLVYNIMVNWLRCCNTGGQQLILDLLSVHLIRKKHGSVIISYHPTKDTQVTTAQYLHTRIRFAGKWCPLTLFLSDIAQKKCFSWPGQSVYWQTIFQKSPDPTFVLLTFIWHTIYAWDEALEALYNHICTMVGCVKQYRMLTERTHAGI